MRTGGLGTGSVVLDGACPVRRGQRGNVTLDNLRMLNAILSVAEQGGTGRGLPKRFGTWPFLSY